MNAPIIHRDILRRHIEAVETMFPIRFLGQLPRGCVGHVDENDPEALEFLVDDWPGASLLDRVGAGLELGDRLGRLVGVVSIGGLKGQEAEEFPKIARPI